MILPKEEFNVYCVEQGLVQQFILDRGDFQQIKQMTAIVRYVLDCLGVARQQLLVSISSTVGEHDETHFFQPYQI